jgi:CheY-like chemotaxis protein
MPLWAKINQQTGDCQDKICGVQIYSMGIFDSLKALSGNRQDKSTNASPQSEKKKILILEDDQKLLDILVLKFQMVGFNVSKAGDGQKGLELVVSDKPNLVLLDLLMPVMDGRTFLKKLKDIPEFSSVPVIILTNAGSLDNMAELRLYNNVKEFLIKANITPDDIVNKVNQII